MNELKECNLDCDLQHEGCCTREDIDCTAKTDSDLMTEEEYETYLKSLSDSELVFIRNRVVDECKRRIKEKARDENVVDTK